MSDLGGKQHLAHFATGFEETVGGGSAPLVIRVLWANWCDADHHAALAYEFTTDNSESGSSLALQNFPACRVPAAATELTRQ